MWVGGHRNAGWVDSTGEGVGDLCIGRCEAWVASPGGSRLQSSKVSISHGVQLQGSSAHMPGQKVTAAKVAAEFPGSALVSQNTKEDSLNCLM